VAEQKIEKMYAFVTADAKNPEIENVVHIPGPWGGFVPLVGADMEKIGEIKKLVKEMVRKSGREIQLVEFTERKQLEVYIPLSKGESQIANRDVQSEANPAS